MTTKELRTYIDRILGNSLRVLLPSYWWKRLFGATIDAVDAVAKNVSSSYQTIKTLQEGYKELSDSKADTEKFYIGRETELERMEYGATYLVYGDVDSLTINASYYKDPIPDVMTNVIWFSNKKKLEITADGSTSNIVWDRKPSDLNNLNASSLYKLEIRRVVYYKNITSIGAVRRLKWCANITEYSENAEDGSEGEILSHMLVIPYSGSLINRDIEANKQFYKNCIGYSTRLDESAFSVLIRNSNYRYLGTIVAINPNPLYNTGQELYVTIRLAEVERLSSFDQSTIYENVYSVNAEGEVTKISTSILATKMDIYIDGKTIYGSNGSLNTSEKGWNATAYSAIATALEGGDLRSLEFPLYLKKATATYFRITEHSPIGMVTGEDATGKYIEFEFQANTMGSVYTCKLREDGTSETTASANILNTPV